MDAIETLRAPLLAELVSAPTLVRELCGLEALVAETYASRVAWELIQKADDAGASVITFRRTGPEVYEVYNDGRSLDLRDLERITRSTLSDKLRGKSIGYRGIGTKSMAGVAQAIEISSPLVSARFDRNLAAAALGAAAEDVPLIRLPFTAEHGASTSEGTTFRLEGVVDWGRELGRLKPEVLLFLRSLERIAVVDEDGRARTFEARRQVGSNHVELVDGDSAVTFRTRSDTDVTLAVPLGGDDGGVFCAFVPTDEPTNSGVWVNADFDTDPSRTRLADTERTRALLAQAGELAGRWAAELALADDESTLAGLMPKTDPRLAAFGRRSSAVALHESSMAAFASADTRPLAPAWASELVVERSALPLRAVPQTARSLPAFEGYRKAAGVAVAGGVDFATSLVGATISAGDAICVLKDVLKEVGVLSMRALPSEAPMWVTDSGRVLAGTQLSDGDRLSPELLASVAEAGLTPDRLAALMKAAGMASVALPEAANQSVGASSTSAGGAARPGQGLVTGAAVHRWRSAEQQVRELLEHEGWGVRDVSRANVGWDLEASRAGIQKYVEVKLVDGEPVRFSLTNNEVVAAQTHRASYEVWVVLKSDADFRFAVVEDPANVLAFERVCRQWDNVTELGTVEWRGAALQ